MRLRKLRVENFRGLRALELEPQLEGVTIIEAPNESGKSSLMEAMRLLLDPRFKDNSKAAQVKAVRPVGRDVGVEIEAELIFEDLELRFSKRFFKETHTRLEFIGRGEVLTGGEAHDRMAAIFSEHVDEALWQQLNFSQGQGLESLALGESQLLAQALDEAASEDAESAEAGEADQELPKHIDAAELFSLIEGEFGRYWSRGQSAKPKKELKEVDERLADADAEVERLEDRLRALESDAARVTVLEASLRQQSADQKQREPELAKARAQLQACEKLDEQARTTRAEADAARAQLEGARQNLATIDSGEARAAQLAKEVEGQKRERDEALAALAEASEKDLREQDAIEAARAEFVEAQAELDAVKERARGIALALELARLRKDLATLDGAALKVATLETQLASETLTAEAVDQLRAACEASALAEASLAAGSPRVEFELGVTDAIVEHDGVPLDLPAQAPHSLIVSERLHLELPGKLDLRIIAGDSAERVREAARGARAQMDRELSRTGVESLAEARRRLDDKIKLQAALDAERNALEALSEQLLAGQDLASSRARIEALEERAAQLEELPAGSDLAQLDAERAEKERLLVEKIETLGDQLRALEAGAVARAETRAELRIREQRSKAKLELRNEEAQLLAQSLPDEASRKAVRLELEALIVADAQASEAHGLAQSSLMAAQPDVLGMRADNLEAAVERGKRELEDQRHELLRARERINERGGEGLGERLLSAQDARVHAQREHDELHARADAARCLYEVMRDARERERRRYREPLKREIVHLGRVVFGPDFDVELAPDLKIARRLRDGLSLPFESLSAGAREQLAIVSALATARLTAQRGVPLVLDDSLGYADRGRLERMGAVLSHAGKQSQILVLTCMAERYASVGDARRISLRDEAHPA
jgi:hypothetical protein